MRDIVSCFSESSVIVSQSSAAAAAIGCHSFSSSNNACISPASSLIPSVRNAVTCHYRTVLSSRRHLLITVTWLRTHTGQALTITFADGPGGVVPAGSFKLNTGSRLLRKKKGSKPVESLSPSAPRIEVFWDLSNARFDVSPEPADNYYVVAVVDSEIGLILGDMSLEAALKRFKLEPAGGKFSLVSRREHCSGNTVYSTRARFGSGGPVHDIVVRFVGEDEGLKHPALLVYVDRKVAMRVKRLVWNFRGNQTMFMDGLLVDLMWDLHDWFFSPGSGSGHAVFMFRTRSGLDSRLWLEEKLLPHNKDEGGGDSNRTEFSLLIYASK